MPGADGYITYSTKLDNENLEKDLSSTTKKIERLEKQLQKNSDKRLPISRRVSELGAQLDKAKAKLVSLQDEAQRIAGAMSNANSNDPASIQKLPPGRQVSRESLRLSRKLWMAFKQSLIRLPTVWTMLIQQRSASMVTWQQLRTMRER